jgi:hypothetical protein
LAASNDYEGARPARKCMSLESTWTALLLIADC